MHLMTGMENKCAGNSKGTQGRRDIWWTCGEGQQTTRKTDTFWKTDTDKQKINRTELGTY